MKMNRLELLGLLKTLSPAIAGAKNQMQELAHVWFDGKAAMAFNDVLGIEVGFPTEFTGGILGEKLMGVLERSRAKDITVEMSGEDALFKIGYARIKLARRPIEDWFWEPEVPSSDGYNITPEFRKAVEMTLISVGSSNVLNPEQRGITIIQGKEQADLYSTDAVSMSWAPVETNGQAVIEGGGRVVIPTVFCECIKPLKNAAELRFDSNAVYYLTKIDLVQAGKKEEGESSKFYDVMVFSKLVDDTEDPVSFVDVVEQNGYDFNSAEIPSELKLRAERALVLLGDQPIELEVEKGDLYLYAQTPYGEVDDVLKLGDHPDVKIKLDMALLRRALDYCNHIAIASNGVVLTGPNKFLHILATK